MFFREMRNGPDALGSIENRFVHFPLGYLREI